MVVGSDPAAGVEIAEAVPRGELWRVLSIRAVLVTDGTAANRQVTFVFGDGTTTFFVTGPNANQVASQTMGYNLCRVGVKGNLSSAGVEVHAPLPPGFRLLPGFTIATLTGNFQSGDNWSAPILGVRKY